MSLYTIQFTTNATDISRQLTRLQAEIARTTVSRAEVTLQLDNSNFVRAIKATFRDLDSQIAAAERRLNSLSIGSPDFLKEAGRIGRQRGLQERGQMTARAVGLGREATAFDEGSLARYERALQSLRIQSSLIAPNTDEWVSLQTQIARINREMSKAATTAKTIQLRDDLTVLPQGSLKSLQAQLELLKIRASEIRPDTDEWKQLNKEIQQTERSIKRISSSPLTLGQRAGAAGGAFLYGGGLGGGVGSAIGGIAGGLAGGVPGAFTGAAVGQFADNIAGSTSAMVEQATAVKKLQLGLASISTGYTDLSSSIQEVERISERLLIPIDEVYRKFTQLRASTAPLGMDVATTGQIFEGVTAAVLRSGGSMDDVSGAMRAVVQVFSKGKLTAEELRGQLGERLPGAVIDFARSSGRSVQELDKAFETGGATLDEFVVFLRGKANDASGFVDSMASRSEFAGARMQKAFERLRLGVGASLQPTGAAIQDFVTQQLNALDKLIRKLIELKAFLPGSDFLASEALAGKDGGVAGLEQRLLEVTAQEEQLRRQAEGVGLGFVANLLPGVREASKEGKRLEEALIKVREILKLTKKDQAQLPSGDSEESNDAERRAKSYLDAVQRREEGIAKAREQLEESLADIRKRGIEQVESLEKQYEDRRRQAERDIAKTRRDLAFELASQEQERGAGLRVLRGDSPDIVEAERELAGAINEYTEEKISREEKAQDEQIKKMRELEDFRVGISRAINEANQKYAKQIGETQRAYAQSVAKIIFEGSKQGAKSLEAAGAVVAALLKQETIRQSYAAQYGAVPGRVSADLPRVMAAAFPGDPRAQELQQLVDAQKAEDAARDRLKKALGASVSAGSVSRVANVDTSDLDARIEALQKDLDSLMTAAQPLQDQLAFIESVQRKIVNLSSNYTRELTSSVTSLDAQNDRLEEQLLLRQKGVSIEDAEQEADSLVTLNKYIDQMKGLVGLAAKINQSTQTRGTLTAYIVELEKELEDSAQIFLSLQKFQQSQNKLFNLQLEDVLATEEKIKEQREESIQLIEQSVSGAMSSYKQFVGDVLKGRGLKEALSQLQVALRDQAVTMFLDFAFKPMEKMIEGQLRQFFNLPNEDELRKQQIIEQQKQTTILGQIRDKIVGAGAVAPSSGVTSTFDGTTAAPAQAIPVQPLQAPTQSPLPFSQQMDIRPALFGTMPAVVEDSLTVTAEAVQDGLDTVNFGIASSVSAFKQAGGALAVANQGWQASLGNTVSAVGMAAGAITSIAGGVSQIKEGGISGVLGGIGSIFMGVGGALGGFGGAGGLGGLFGGGSSFASKIPLDFVHAPNIFGQLAVPGFANGGVVNGPTLGLVGEGRYNEAIVPLPDGRSIPVKMAGGQSAREAMSNGGMPSYAPSTVSFSFETTKINGVEYVSRDQLELAMASTRREAIKEGAKRGMSMTLDKIQQSPGTRRSIAMGRR